MTWLAGWLKEVIMVVLFAAFVDLILPNRSMERYVKLVLSLLILLTLLNPMIKLITREGGSQLALAFNRWNQSGSGSGSGLNQIMAQAEGLREARATETLAWAAREAAGQMKEQIRKQTGQVVDVTVSMKLPPASPLPGQGTSSPYIERVQVVLKAAAASSAKSPEAKGTEASGPIGIEPVQPVAVTVPKVTTGEHATAAAATAEPPASEQQKNIQHLLATSWGLEMETIHVEADHL